MNNQQFIYWLGGFIDAVGQEGPTSEQWETIVSKLNQVAEPVSFPFGVPNTAPIQTLPFIQPADPYNPYKVTCGTTGESSVTLTTTSGSGSTYNIPGITTHGNTSWTNLPKGANVSYTANLPKELLTD